MKEENKNVVAVVESDPTKSIKTPTIQKKPSRPELQIMKRLEGEGEDSLPAVIYDLSGKDKLFAEKFVTCTKAQIRKAWKRTEKGWSNPFNDVPLQSILDCLYKCATRKILPDGYNAYLIPYLGRNPTCSLQIDYKGLIDCAIREGVILDADAKEVCENDDFVWDCGEVTRFTFDFRQPRGKICGVCAWVILPNGRKKWHYMSNDELEKIRSCVRDTSIWDKWGTEMAKKSALRRVFKTLRNTPHLNDMMEADNETFDVQGEFVDKPTRGKGRTSKILTPYETPKQIEATPAELPAEAVEISQEEAHSVEVDPFM